MKNSFLNLLWWLTPNWVGAAISHLNGGRIWTKEFDTETGKTIRFYWQSRNDLFDLSKVDAGNKRRLK